MAHILGYYTENTERKKHLFYSEARTEKNMQFGADADIYI